MKTVIDMALEANLQSKSGVSKSAYTHRLQYFAELVRADEREACAVVCDNRGVKFWAESPFAAECHGLATAIRARGQK